MYSSVHNDILYYIRYIIHIFIKKITTYRIVLISVFFFILCASYQYNNGIIITYICSTLYYMYTRRRKPCTSLVEQWAILYNKTKQQIIDPPQIIRKTQGKLMKGIGRSAAETRRIHFMMFERTPPPQIWPIEHHIKHHHPFSTPPPNHTHYQPTTTAWMCLFQNTEQQTDHPH